MQTTILIIIFSILISAVYAQKSFVTTSNISRPVPKLEHVFNNLTQPSWDNKSFIDTVQKLNLQLIRYSCKKESQYFEEQMGRVLNASLWTNGKMCNYCYKGTEAQLSHHQNFKAYISKQI